MFNIIQQGNQTCSTSFDRVTKHVQRHSTGSPNMFNIKKYTERLILTAVKETKAQKTKYSTLLKRYSLFKRYSTGYNQTCSTLFNRVAKPV